MATFVAAFVVALACSCGKSEPTPAPTPDPAALSIVIEAESAEPLPPTMKRLDAADAGGAAALGVPDGVLKTVPEPGRVRYAFNLDEPAALALWLRVRWDDGCGNSIFVALDSAAPFSAGDDRTYRVWHWIRAARLDLAAGPHTLDLSPGEDGVAVDQILLTADLAAWPRGIMRAKTQVDNGAASNNTVAPFPAAAERRPFVVGLGGCYRRGYESILVRLGIPFERLLERDMSNVEVLRRYDMLCISKKNYTPSHPTPAGLLPANFVPAIEAYLKGGGTAIVDHTAYLYDRFVPIEDRRRLTLPLTFARQGWYVPDCGMAPDGSALFADLDSKGMQWDKRFAVRPIPVPVSIDGAETFGKLTWRNSTPAAAVLKRPVGKGTLYLCGAPLGIMVRSAGHGDADVLVRNLILDAVGERTHAVLRSVPLHSDVPEAGLLFADDFMADPGPPGAGWRVESGVFALTGPKPREASSAFSLTADGPGLLAAVADPTWTDYRLAASLLPGRGRAGIWITAGKTRYSLVLDGKDSRVLLKAASAGAADVVVQQAVPRYAGWRRLSLVPGPDALVGYLDGEAVLRAPLAAPPALRSEFGLVVEDGAPLFDDVSARRADVLVSGTDRAFGEEGSCFARSTIAPEIIEARNMYTRRWFLRGDPAGEPALRLLLPNYLPGRLMVGERTVAAVPPSPRGACISLAETGLPDAPVAFVCPGWRDYTFCDRLTDWYSTDGVWLRRSRWTCSPEWHWLGTRADGTSVLWHKRRFAPSYALSAIMVPSALDTNSTAIGLHVSRDINIVVAGDGRSLASGYALRVNAAATGCELRYRNRVLARAPGIGVPSHYTVHTDWFEVRAVVDPNRLRFYFDGVLAIDYAPPEPVPTGHLGIWTMNNAISLARVTISSGPDPTD